MNDVSVETMRLDTKSGEYVRFLAANGYESERFLACKRLTKDTVYQVQEVSIGGWSSTVSLVGYEGMTFNTVMFTNTPAPVMTLELSQRQFQALNSLYIGKDDLISTRKVNPRFYRVNHILRQLTALGLAKELTVDDNPHFQITTKGLWVMNSLAAKLSEIG